MDLKEIKQVIDLMETSDLTEFEIESQGLKLRIKRDNGRTTTSVAPTVVAMPAAAPSAPAAPATSKQVASNNEEGVVIIKSPMVGTFYRSPSPDSDSFVAIGSQVKKDSVVCIIEAMKVLNEIHAEVSGTITEILVENEGSVEFGQPLFKVKTS